MGIGGGFSGGTDPDVGTLGKGGEELDEVGIAHEEAPVGAVFGEGRRVVGAVDVDVPGKGIDSGAGVEAFLEAAQAEDAGGDEGALAGAAVGPVLPALAGGDPALEDRSGWGVVAMAGGDFVEAPRGSTGILEAGAGALAGGNGVVADPLPVPEVVDFFLAKVDHEDIFRSV